MASDLVQDFTLEHLLSQWNNYIPIAPDDYKSLVDAGYIDPASHAAAGAQKIMLRPNPLYVQREVDEEEDYENFGSASSFKSDNRDSAYYKPFHQYIPRSEIRLLYVKHFGGGPHEHIEKRHWMPDSVTSHTNEFVDWVNSILYDGFQNRRIYSKFDLYRRQAYQWLDEATSLEKTRNNFEANEFKREELRKCEENSLYALNKYLMLKDGSAAGGWTPFVADPHQEICLYLDDCGYSEFIVKGRQIGLTSVKGGIASIKIIFRPNYFIKYIAQDETKTEEIFADKIKAAFSELPEWWRFYTNKKGERQSIVLNDRDNILRLARKDDKGEIGGHDSKIQVQPPSTYAINGGSPPWVMIDEAIAISDFSKMMKEGKPTMFARDLSTGKMKMVRQLSVWTTGGVEEAASKAFEREYYSVLKQWKENPHECSIIPLFFDWTCRPGITPADYDREKYEYYSTTGPDSETSKIQFHQHFPTTIDDVFLTSQVTLVSIKYISDRLNVCRSLDFRLRAERGRMVPIFDKTKPLGENSWLPYKVIGATFAKADHTDDPKNQCVTIFMHPELEWVNRYYAGTDPTSSVQTVSLMSTSIWDEELKTFAAVVNTDFVDYRERFLQCALLSLYYSGPNNPCWELIEKNLGLAYQEFKSNIGLDGNLVTNMMLPDSYRSSNDIYGYGIDNRRGEKNKRIIQAMYNVFKDYGSRIYIEDYWLQLKTFVKKQTNDGNETWGASNKKYHKDDSLFSGTFAYICRSCFDGVMPKKTAEGDKNKNIRVAVGPFSYDSSFNLIYER